jgi:WD40 repeat protein/serine/threonine protein kinase
MLAPDMILHNRYRVVYQLDERSDYQLYRARDEQSGSLVLLCSLGGNAEQVEEFRAAASHLTTLSHAALLPLTDHFDEQGRFFLVCNDPGGMDLERVMRNVGMALPENQALDQMIRLLDAVDLLHNQKPPFLLGTPTTNDIWVIEGGAWRLLPFTLIRPFNHQPTPYLAPEMLKEGTEPTTSSDIYALSAVLYQAVCGWPPPASDQRQAGIQLNMPRALNPQVSPLAEQLLLRGLQTVDRNRYQYARELRVALETVRMMIGRPLGLGYDPISEQLVQVSPQGTPPPPTPPYPPQPATAYPPQPPTAPPAPSGPPNYYAPPAYPPYSPAPPPQMAAQPGYAPAPLPEQRQGASIGCLVSVAVLLTMMGTLIAAAFYYFLVLQPGQGASTPSAPTAVATTAPAGAAATAVPSGTPFPTTAPVVLGADGITLSSVNNITRTQVITTEIAGPVMFSPDGRQIAIGITNDISLRAADLRGSSKRLAGHTGQMNVIVFSPDSRLIASGAVEDSVIRLWDAQSGALLRELQGHQGWIRSLMFSPDGRVLASGSSDSTINLWDPATGTLLRTLQGHTGYLGNLDFAPDGATLASASRDGTVRLWDVQAGSEKSGFAFRTEFIPNTTQRAWTTSVVFAPDGKTIAAGAIDGNIYLLDPATGNELGRLTGHNGWVVLRGLAFAPDSKTLYSASLDRSIRSWDVTTRQQTGLFEGHRFGVGGIALSPDGTRLLSTSNEDGEVFLWDVSNRQQLETLRIGQGVVTALAYAPDGSLLSSAGVNGVSQLYQLAQNRGRFFTGNAATIQPMAFVADNQMVIVSEEGTLVVIPANQNEGRELTGLNGMIINVVASRDGQRFAAGTADGNVAIWEVNNPQPKTLIDSNVSTAFMLAFSSDAELLAVAGPDDTSTIEIYQVGTGTRVQQLTGATNGVLALSFQPGGKLLAATDGEGAFHIWDIQQGTQLQDVTPTEEQGRFTAMSFSGDGSLVAIATQNGEILLIEPLKTSAAGVLEIGADATALSFSSDGTQLAVALRDDASSIFVFGVRGQ